MTLKIVLLYMNKVVILSKDSCQFDQLYKTVIPSQLEINHVIQEPTEVNQNTYRPSLCNPHIVSDLLIHFRKLASIIQNVFTIEKATSTHIINSPSPKQELHMPYCTFEHHCFRDICWFSVKTTLVNQSKAVSTQNDVMQISNLTLDVQGVSY